MKKVILLVLAIAALSFTGCSNDESNQIALGTANVAINPKPQTQGRAQQRTDVKRGDIYAWVKSINVKATSKATGYSTEETFDLVDNSSNATSNFVIKNVQEGENIFVASTTTSSVPTTQHFNITNATDKAAVIKTFVDRNPYALYSSGEVEEDISMDSPNFVNLPMSTEHGRRISLFRIGDGFMKAYYYIEVITYKNGVVQYASEVRGDQGVVAYWSDEDTKNGAEIIHKIKVRKKSNSRVIKVFTIEEEVHASVSNSCTYSVVRGDSVIKDEQALTFTWQEWVEEGCDYCPDDNNDDD